jgi:hypothetical protein
MILICPSSVILSPTVPSLSDFTPQGLSAWLEDLTLFFGTDGNGKLMKTACGRNLLHFCRIEKQVQLGGTKYD